MKEREREREREKNNRSVSGVLTTADLYPCEAA